MTAAPALLGLFALILGLLGARDLIRGGVREGGQPGGTGRRQGESMAARNGGRSRTVRNRAGPSSIWTGGDAPVMATKVLGAATGIAFGSVPAGILPGRLGPVMLLGAGLGGFLLPDLMRARAARRRHRRMITALPDALDLLAVSVATGRGLGGGFVDLAESGRGPLIEELAEAGEDMAWGSGQAAAMASLRDRIGGPEIGAFCATVERSRRLGSPLADQLRRQSATLRQDQRRAIEEQAARAAPKIQLVVALVLVPSVLLLIVAALIANADTLIPSGLMN